MSVPGPYWAQPPDALLAALGATRDGLASREAARRLLVHGENRLEDGRRDTALVIALRQVANPLVLILVFGAAISAFVGDWLDAAIIVAIVAGSALLGFVQEYRGSQAMEALRRRLALRSRVLRDGHATVVPSTALVPGDVIELSAGQLVPADGVVLAARDFLVNEAALTGESFPVEKRPGASAADAAPGARANAVLTGTSVRSGFARVLVVVTGGATAYAAIAREVAARGEATAFGLGLRRFGYLLLRVMVVMVVFVLAVNHALGRPVLDSLLFAIALAVGLSPELLPAIVSVTLSRGARGMAARGVVVRRLEAIENLGSIDVLCTDKTGTLTQGAMALHATLDPDGAPSEAVARLAFLNAVLETGIDNPLDAAIIEAARRDGRGVGSVQKVDEIPYDFARRRLTIVVDEGEPGRHRIVTKGAVREVLAICEGRAAGSVVEALDGAARARLDAFSARQGAAGFRVLALATRVVDARAAYERADEAEMTLVGFLLFADPVKPAARQALADLADRGIRTKIVTGDNRFVAAHVAREVGLDPDAMLVGDEIARMRDEALARRAEAVDLFVEVEPHQKARIVAALRHAGHVVGYLGDGINDAPPLAAADVGISVDGAVDAARAAADVVLLGPDLDVLRAGVEEGRRAFANTLKYIAITTSANFGNMVSMALATPFLPFLPLAAKQVLLNNFLSDIPSVAISTDAVDAEQVARAERWDVDAVRRFMIVFGLVSTAFDLLTFALLRLAFRADEPTFQTAWFVVSLLTELAVVLVLRTARPSWTSRPGSLLAGATGVAVVVAIAFPYVPPLARMFGFVPVGPGVLVSMLVVVVGYVVATEAVKGIERTRRREGPSAVGRRLVE